MAIMKSREPKIPTEKTRPKPTPKPKKQAEEKVKIVPTITMYKSVGIPMTHPFQNVRLNPGVPVACILDGWLEAQLDAGLVVEVKK